MLIAAIIFSGISPVMAQSVLLDANGNSIGSSTSGVSASPYGYLTTTPNYWGDYRNSPQGLGTYNNPYTGGNYISNGQATFYRPNTTPYYQQNLNSGNSSGRFSGVGLGIAGGMMGVSAMQMGIAGIGRKNVNAKDPTQMDEKELAKMEARRKKQEDKIKAHLEAAHAEEMRRKGITPMQATPQKFADTDLEGDVLSTKQAQAVDGQF